MKAHSTLLAAGCLCLTATTLAKAGEPSANLAPSQAFYFSSFNQAALARSAPLPSPMLAAASGVVLDWTSEFLIEEAADESLLLDGEILRAGLRGRWRHAAWTLWGEAPLLIAGGGVLDAGIEQWHEWFGLPNGNREFVADNQYHYSYSRNGETLFDIEQGDTTLGDLRLGAAYCDDGGSGADPAAGCWNAMLQLPTADANELLGGGLGLAAWYERGYRLGTQFSGVLGGGGFVQRRQGPLEAQMRPANVYGWASLGYALTQRLQAGAQLYVHSPLFEDSALGALARAGGQLSFGLRLALASGATLSLAAQEDIITQSSPDFVIQLAWLSGS